MSDLVRIVRMTFDPGGTDRFLEIFEEAAPAIRSFPGCRHLELIQDRDDPTVFATYSIWEGDGALQRYRQSELFRSTWRQTRRLFAGEPEAASYRRRWPDE